jgi:predicted nucleic acid-binding protein
MPERPGVVVVNTTPIIALATATGSLDALKHLYGRVGVPEAVRREVLAGGVAAPGVAAFNLAGWLEGEDALSPLPPYLANSLDLGEAAVIQTALERGIALVCIDETVGRRVARLSGLNVTGSIGVLLKARQQGFAVDIPSALARMREQGIWLSDVVVRFALEQAALLETR